MFAYIEFISLIYRQGNFTGTLGNRYHRQASGFHIIFIPVCPD